MVNRYYIRIPLLFSVYPINTTRIRLNDILTRTCFEGRHVLSIVVHVVSFEL